jgi:hypothetical protein
MSFYNSALKSKKAFVVVLVSNQPASPAVLAVVVQFSKTIFGVALPKAIAVQAIPEPLEKTLKLPTVPVVRLGAVLISVGKGTPLKKPVVV